MVIAGRLVLILAMVAWVSPATASPALTDALREGGLVVLMRHARAPGTGDPSTFRIDDCTTQRNLDERGRKQARRAGQFFRDASIAFDEVRSSAWCRCLETARLMALGPEVTLFAPLDSFFETRARGPAQIEAIQAFIEDWEGTGNVMLVTHQVNITGATGVHPRSGDAVVLRPNEGGFEVLGRFEPGAD